MRSLTTAKAISAISVMSLAVVLGIVTAFVLPRISGSSVTHGDWPHYFDGDRLIEDSQRIVTGRFVDEEKIVIPSISPVDGQPHGSTTEIFRRFVVVDSLKGDTVGGQEIYVVTTAGVTRDLSFEAYETIDLEPGHTYALFLEAIPTPDRFPRRFGDILWVAPGEPGIAEVSGDRLKFLATSRYNGEVNARQLDTAADSAAPFEFTKATLASRIQAAGATSMQ